MNYNDKNTCIDEKCCISGQTSLNHDVFVVEEKNNEKIIEEPIRENREESARWRSIPELIEIEPSQEGYRWVAISAMLLAIGIILHTVSPNVGGITPNWTIAMYAIAINLTRPKLKQAIGIGFIAGLTLIPSSKSAFPLGNIVSEVFGAITCWMLLKALVLVNMKDCKILPLISGFAATFISGGIFTLILKFVLGLPLSVWIYAMLPLVAVIGLLNGVITQALFRPVKKLFFAQED